MIELSRHIENLLLEHECVIVPGLGGFVTHYVPASWDKEEQIFIPPYKNVGFNPQLILNDGLLVQSYMQVHETGYVDALRMIEDAVANIKSILHTTGEYDLGGVGNLYYKIDGRYEFEPYESGITSPNLYGLYSFSAKSTSQKVESALGESKKTSVKSVKKSASKGTTYTLNINRDFIHYVSAAIIAAIFYFSWSAPSVIESSGMTENMAVFGGIQNKEVKKQIVPETLEMVNSVEANLKQEVKIETSKEVSPFYTIVLASAISKKNASEYVNSLRDSGFEDATVHITRTMVRVIYGSYNTENQAYQELQKLNNNKAFAQAWVMKLK